MDEENAIQPPDEGQAHSDGKKSGKRKKLIIGGIVLILLAVILALGLRQCNTTQEDDSGIIIGAGIKEGELERDNEDVEEAGEAGEPGSNGTANMTVRINGYPVFEDGESEGDLNIENPIENVLYMEVEITLDDTGEVIYNSGYIPPNHYIDSDKLDVVLGKGDYNATAYVTLVDPDNPDSQYNASNFNLSITINN